MKKLLISWIATLNDFQSGTTIVSEKGPTYEIHKNKNYNYDEHIILYSGEKNVIKIRNIIASLKAKFRNRRITELLVELNDVWDVKEIKPKVEKVIMDHSGDDITVFTNPGTKPMFMAWILIAAQNIWNIKLVTMRDPEHNRKADTGIIEVELEKSAITGIILKEQTEGKKNKEYVMNDEPIITKSLENVYKRANAIAQMNEFSVLIKGETGTGKEKLAEYFLKRSVRKDKEFRAINCAAFDDSLLRSELFGYVKGSFTGADKDKKGFFEVCNGGTIFMDEIGDVSLKMQATLLRVINEKEFQKVGSTETQKTNINLIFATNKDLESECQKGKFRYDLLHRISLPELEMPSFREMLQDEKMNWITHFLVDFAKKINRTALTFSSDVYDLLLKYSFPGNIRELRSIIYSLYLEFGSDEAKTEIKLSELPTSILKRLHSAEVDLSSKESLERDLILRVLTKNNYNQAKTAKEIGIAVNTLKKKINDYKIPIPGK